MVYQMILRQRRRILRPKFKPPATLKTIRHHHSAKVIKKIPKIGQRFIDNRKKKWDFCAKIPIRNAKQRIRKQFSMDAVMESKNGIYWRCQKVGNGPSGRCPLKGIFLKLNGCLYVRGMHEHERPAGNEKAHPKIDGKNVTKEKKMPMKRVSPKARQNNQPPPNGRKKHQPPKAAMNRQPAQKQNCQMPPQNQGQIFVDSNGRIWEFRAEIGPNPNVPAEHFYLQFGLAKSHTLKNGLLYLRCRKKGGTASDGRCQFAGIYGNGNLYTRGEHEHVVQEENGQIEGNVQQEEPGEQPNNIGGDGIVQKNLPQIKNLGQFKQIERQNGNPVENSQQIFGNQQNGVQLGQLDDAIFGSNELEIIAEINLGKWLPHFKVKREGDVQIDWPIITIDDDPGEENGREPRAKKRKLPRVKKEVPDEEEEQQREEQWNVEMAEYYLPHPPILAYPMPMPAPPPLPAPAPAPPKPKPMLLRERKVAINYRKLNI